MIKRMLSSPAQPTPGLNVKATAECIRHALPASELISAGINLTVGSI